MGDWDGLKDVIAGSARGATQIAVGHPFDTLKVRLQVNAAQRGVTSAPSYGPQFKGLYHCTAETWRCDGIRGFYKGASSPILGCALYSATLFFAWGQSQKIVRNFSSDAAAPLSIKQLICAGMMTGTAASLVEGPVDLIKTKLQTQYSSNYSGSSSGQKKLMYRGSIDCFRALVQQKGGIKNLYYGIHATLLRNVPGSITYFTSYELFKRMLSKNSPNSDKPSQTTVIVAGGLAGLVFWTTIFPFDVIKSHIQSTSPSPPAPHQKSNVPAAPQQARMSLQQAFWELHNKGGWRRFFCGLSPALLRAFPTNGLSFLAFESCRNMLG